FRRNSVLVYQPRKHLGNIQRQNIRFGNIDSDRYRTNSFIYPQPDSFAYFIPYILIQLGNVSVLFKYRYKYRRGNQSQFCMVPAHQGLRADDSLSIQIKSWLKIEREFAILESC